jgi:hypothetical protein
MVPLAEAAVAVAAVPPELLELAVPVVAPTTAGATPVTCGEAVPLVVVALVLLVLLVLGVLLSVLPASLEPPQPASATLKATASRPAPDHLPALRLPPLFMSLASLLEGGKPSKRSGELVTEWCDSSADGVGGRCAGTSASPATPLSHVQTDHKTGGFASPPYDGFALTLRSQLIHKRAPWQSVTRFARLRIATRCSAQPLTSSKARVL